MPRLVAGEPSVKSGGAGLTRFTTFSSVHVKGHRAMGGDHHEGADRWGCAVAGHLSPGDGGNRFLTSVVVVAIPPRST